MQTLLSHSEEAAVNALCSAVTRHIEIVNNLQTPNCLPIFTDNLWKIYEACIVALSTAKETVVEQQHCGKLQFDIIRFLDSVVLSTLNNAGNTYNAILLIVELILLCKNTNLNKF